MNRYTFKGADLRKDGPRLRRFFNQVFDPEKVGDFAESLTLYFPRMEGRSWFLAEEDSSGEIAAGCALIPWKWRMEHVVLDVAELGIVGTGEAHRKQGLMRRLHAAFMETVREKGFHLVVIQGIPGFYDKLGFRYALPLCAHIDLPLHAVTKEEPGNVTFRPAGIGDIPFLVEEDEAFARANVVSAVRGVEHWTYLLTDGQKTEYSSEFLIFEDAEGRKGYARLPRFGFGSGLIVSEVSEGISWEMGAALLGYCRRLAEDRGKPYIRLDLHPDAPLSRLALASGAVLGDMYAWQVLVPDHRTLLLHLAPVLEKRLERGLFSGYSGVLRLDFFDESLDLIWCGGRLTEIRPGDAKPCAAHFCVHRELFPSLCLGHRSWRELQQTRPDVFPALSHTGSRVERVSDPTESLIDELFPPRRSWIYEQY